MSEPDIQERISELNENRNKNAVIYAGYVIWRLTENDQMDMPFTIHALSNEHASHVGHEIGETARLGEQIVKLAQ